MNSPSLALIKEVAALRQKKGRDDSGLILVEGRHPIEEALRAALNLRYFFILPTHPGHLPVERYPQTPFAVDEHVMRRLSTTDSPPPCLAVFEKPLSPSAFQGSFALVLDSLQDPGNLGTLIRSAAAFGVNGVILTGDSAEAYNPKVIRASAGLVFSMPMFIADHQRLQSLLPEEIWQVYTTSGQSEALNYRNADFSGHCALVLGNEGRGISSELFAGRINLQTLTIPMDPTVESLNVAISGSIILAEAAARRETASITQSIPAERGF
jgi:TrmH family RNA methyltransferase